VYGLPYQSLQCPATIAYLDDMFSQGLQMLNHLTHVVISSRSQFSIQGFSNLRGEHWLARFGKNTNNLQFIRQHGAPIPLHGIRHYVTETYSLHFSCEILMVQGAALDVSLTPEFPHPYVPSAVRHSEQLQQPFLGLYHLNARAVAANCSSVGSASPINYYVNSTSVTALKHYTRAQIR